LIIKAFPEKFEIKPEFVDSGIAAIEKVKEKLISD
jgi:hypothetical protein